MTTDIAPYVDESVNVTGGSLRLLKKGNGAPLLVLHHSIGNHGWLPLYEQLSQRFTVYVPDLPGFGQSDRPDWARSVRDLAIQMHLMLDRLGIDRVTLLGLGFGGWVAAEMATMNQRRLDCMILVGAAGLQPHEGEIVDQLTIDYIDYIHLGFADEEAFNRHFGEDPPRDARLRIYGAREMTMRVTFRPWMFNRVLPPLLQDVTTPTVVVWGENDRIIPLDCGKQYAEYLPNARLVVLEGAGHFVDMERPAELAELITEVAVAL